jgi:hypothetical protein
MSFRFAFSVFVSRPIGTAVLLIFKGFASRLEV